MKTTFKTLINKILLSIKPFNSMLIKIGKWVLFILIYLLIQIIFSVLLSLYFYPNVNDMIIYDFLMS